MRKFWNGHAKNQKGNFDDSSGKVRADKAAGIELYAFAGAQRATASETWEANDIVEKAKKEGKLPQSAKPTVDNLKKIGIRDEKAKQLAQSVAQNERQQKGYRMTTRCLPASEIMVVRNF